MFTCSESEILEHLRNSNISITDISKKLGCSYGAVYRVYRRHLAIKEPNIPLRKVGRRPKKVLTFQCKYCKKDFQSKDNSRKYCSSMCANARVGVRKRVIQLLKDGNMSYRDIGKRLGCSAQRVCQISLQERKK